jgi:hypothetical protein
VAAGLFLFLRWFLFCWLSAAHLGTCRGLRLQEGGGAAPGEGRGRAALEGRGRTGGCRELAAFWWCAWKQEGGAQGLDAWGLGKAGPQGGCGYRTWASGGDAEAGPRCDAPKISKLNHTLKYSDQKLIRRQTQALTLYVSPPS